MKQITVLALALLLIGSTGCKKMLNRDLEDQTRGTVIDFNDLTSMYAPVSAIYRKAIGGNPGFGHWIDCGLRSVRGDDVDKGSSPNDQGILTNIKMFDNANPGVVTFWGTNNFWNNAFGFAIYCNQAMMDLDQYGANIPPGDAFNQSRFLQYKGELRVLRAFAFLLASRVFGDIPIITDNSTLATIGKSSALEVRQFIISQMDSSIATMDDLRPNQSANQGSVTRYTALLLKAKAAADAAGNDNSSPFWDDVISATDQIINSNKFTLFPDFYQLFKKPGKLSDESLFELQYTDFGTTSGTSIGPDAFFVFQGPSGNQQGSPVSGWGFLQPTQAIADFLNSRNDSVRLKTSILQAGATETTFVLSPSGDRIFGNSNGQVFFMGKAYLPANQMTPGRTDYGSNNNIRVLRYSDALLLNAEAKVRKGQNGDVPFNLVRQRAQLNPITGVTLDMVLDERRAEFACEWWGERYNDLLRTGQAAAVLAPFGFTPGKEFLPIPQAQRDLNENL
ncbi:MAG: RagB/SusD family nutrient uptake outer membrane protein [Chitinophagaceae bacterium]